MSVILAIGAHFDDVEFGMGGTLLRHAENKDKIYVIISNSDEFRTGDIDERKKEQLNSLKTMGLSGEDLLLFTAKDNEKDIISELDKLKPDVVYTHYIKDTHQDHIRGSIIGQSVGRKKSISTMFYDSGSSYEFHPVLFNIIDFEKKTVLLECFKSQLQRGSVSIEDRKLLDAYQAYLCFGAVNVYAEGFVTRRVVMSWA